MLEYIDTQFHAHKHEENAVYMEKYMKGHFPFYGIKGPLREEIFRDFNESFTVTGYEELMEMVMSLWEREAREYQFFAMDLLYKYKKLWNENFIGDMEKLILSKSWWDTVDMLSGKYCSLYFLKHPESMKATYLRWSRHANMWLNRSAIIGQLRMNDATDRDLLEACIKPHVGSNEFFLRKGIGWALRQFSKTDPGWVIAFTQRYPLKPLSEKEALRLLPGKGDKSL